MAAWEEGTEFPSYWKLKQLTLDIAADLFMGGAQDTGQAEMDRINKAFIACVQAAAGIVRINAPFTRWGRAYRGRKVLEKFLRHYLPAKHARQTDDIFSVLCHVENEDGVRCVGAPVFDHENRIAGGLSVAGPTYRMTAERVREFGPEAVATAAELSRRLGWAGGKAT